MAYNQMLARHHQGTRKIVISDNIFVTEKCSDGETSTEQALTFLRPASYVDAAVTLCEALQSAWAADQKTQKINTAAVFTQRGAYITVKVESLR